MKGSAEFWFNLERLKKKFVLVNPKTGCWLWSGCKNNKGYGTLSHRGRLLKAHRVFFHLATGFDLDSPLLVMHKCMIKNCVNPDHLQVGTESDNRSHYWWNYQTHQNLLQKR